MADPLDVEARDQWPTRSWPFRVTWFGEATSQPDPCTDTATNILLVQEGSYITVSRRLPWRSCSTGLTRRPGWCANTDAMKAASRGSTHPSSRSKPGWTLWQWLGGGGRGGARRRLASPWRSSWFSPRTRFCSVLLSRSSRPASEAWRGSGGAVLRRDQVRSRCLTWKPGHYFYELLFWQTLALVSCDSLRWLLEEFLAVFYANVHTNPEVDSRSHLKILIFSTSPLYLAISPPGCVSLGRGFWTNFTHFQGEGELRSWGRFRVHVWRTLTWRWRQVGFVAVFFLHFSHSVQLDVKCPVSVEFLELSVPNCCWPSRAPLHNWSVQLCWHWHDSSRYLSETAATTTTAPPRLILLTRGCKLSGHHTLQCKSGTALHCRWLISESFGEARSQPEVCRGSVSSPMVVDVVLTGGLDRRALAFLRGVLTHASADSNLYRKTLRVNYLRAGRRSSFDGLGVSAIVLHEQQAGRREGDGGGGRHLGGLHGFLPGLVLQRCGAEHRYLGGALGGPQGLSRDRVLQRLVEQIIESSSWCAHGSRSRPSRFSSGTGWTSLWSRLSSKIVSQDRVHQRFEEQNIETPRYFLGSLTWVWWRRSPSWTRLVGEFFGETNGLVGWWFHCRCIMCLVPFWLGMHLQ